MVALASWLATALSHGAATTTPPVSQLRITVLSTNLAGDPLEKGIGEWGYAALVEVNGKKLLFDTGNRPNTVLHNARELGIDLSDITEVVLSHHHIDHTGGLLALRRAYVGTSATALSRVHVARGAFWSRGAGPYAGDENPLRSIRPAFEATGGTFIEHAEPVELLPGVWFAGGIPRTHAEQDPIPGDKLHLPGGSIEADTVPEDAALIFDTDRGLVVLTGCAHAGLINTLEYAKILVRPGATIHAAVGGFHLARSSDAALEWTAGHLRTLGLRQLHAGHCTGLESLYRFRSLVGLDRDHATVAAVGAWFDLEQGIHPLVLAR